MAEPGPLRARLGELARARKARMGPDAMPDALPDADPGGSSGAPAAHAGAAGLARTGSRLGTDTLATHDPPPAGAPWVPGPVSAPRRGGVRGDDDIGREPGSGEPPPGFSAPAVGVEEFLPGGEWRDSPDFTGRPGAVYVHERLRSAIEKRKPHWGRIESPPPHEPALIALAARGLEHALFLDLETCGLSNSAVFLAGTMHWNGEDFVLRQYFARHYGEEGPLLRALNESLAGFEHLVTFNGKTFDVPFLQGRAVVHGVRLALPPYHLDLLHASRRRWRGEFADCRLKTLESRVCRRHRVGDVPGEEIPALYHDYVKFGDPYRLVPVFHHNLLDVITMSDLLRALCRPARAAMTPGVGAGPGR